VIRKNYTQHIQFCPITDESDDFYFKRPFRLNLDQEGFIYFQDGDFFLKFSPEGDYVGNLSHQGQGPGEVQSLRYNIQGETINAWDTRGRKVVFYDLDGQFLREFKPDQHFGMRRESCLMCSLHMENIWILSISPKRSALCMFREISCSPETRMRKAFIWSLSIGS
jgi:hypothetical protein